MSENAANELIATARHNRKHLIGATIVSNIDNSNYSLRINGVGAKAIKLELFLTYEDILDYHNHKHLENVIYDKINTVYHSKGKGTVWRVNK